MRTSYAALELDLTEPSITAAKAVADTIARNGSLQRDTLHWVMEQTYGASSADGHWSLRDAYDMLELAEVMYLAKADLPANPAACLAALTELVANLPTHTARSEEQIKLQQFSMPAPIAYAKHGTSQTVSKAAQSLGTLTIDYTVFAEAIGLDPADAHLNPARHRVRDPLSAPQVQALAALCRHRREHADQRHAAVRIFWGGSCSLGPVPETVPFIHRSKDLRAMPVVALLQRAGGGRHGPPIKSADSAA